jgi:hypothetical protein
MRNRWNDFKCHFTADLLEDKTHEVDYTSAAPGKNITAPHFSVTLSIADLVCHVRADIQKENPEAFRLFDGSKATLCISTEGAEFAPELGQDHSFQLATQTKSAFIAVRVPSVEVASSMATQMRTHKRIGVFIEFAANEKDFAKFEKSHLITIPIWSVSITYYGSEAAFE